MGPSRNRVLGWVAFYATNGLLRLGTFEIFLWELRLHRLESGIFPSALSLVRIRDSPAEDAHEMHVLCCLRCL